MNESDLEDAVAELVSHPSVDACNSYKSMGFVAVFDEETQSFEGGMDIISSVLADYEPYEVDNFAGEGGEKVRIAVFCRSE